MVSRFTLAFAFPLAVACAPVGGEGESAAPRVDSDVEGALFVAGKFGNTLSKVDLASGEQVVSVDSCANPHELATSPDDLHIALACYGGQTVDIFRTADLTKVASIDLGANARPHGIVWHTNGDLYATAEGRQSVFWIRDPLEQAEVFESGTGKEGSHMLAVAPSGNHAWTTDLGSKTVTRSISRPAAHPHRSKLARSRKASGSPMTAKRYGFRRADRMPPSSSTPGRWKYDSGSRPGISRYGSRCARRVTMRSPRILPMVA